MDRILKYDRIDYGCNFNLIPKQLFTKYKKEWTTKAKMIIDNKENKNTQTDIDMKL